MTIAAVSLPAQDRVVELTYQASVDPNLWASTLDAICGQIDCDGAVLKFNQLNSELPPRLVFTSNLNPLYQDEFVTTIEQKISLELSFGMLDEIVTDSYRSLSIVTRSGGQIATMSVFNRVDASFGPEARLYLQAFSVDLYNAMRVTAAVIRQNSTDHQPIALIKNLSSPIGLASGTGEIQAWNWRAIALAARHGFQVDATDSAWRSACRQAVREGAATYCVVDGIQARIARIRDKQDQNHSVLGAYSIERLLVEISVDESIIQARDPLADFTTSEREVWHLMKSGLDVQAVASVRRSSVATVLEHLKKMRRKAGLRSTAALMTLSKH